MDIYDVVIVGAGPAGLAASIYCYERKLTAIVLEAKTPGGQPLTLYGNKNVYDFPSYPAILGQDLAIKIFEHAQLQHAKIITGITVSTISKNDGVFELHCDASRYQSRTVLLATGMGHYMPRKLKIPGEDEFLGNGVVYQSLTQARLTGTRLVVVGGGDTAFEMAIAAAEKGATVTLIHRRDKFRAMETTVEKAQALAINLVTNTNVVATQGMDKLETITIKDNSGKTAKISVDHLVICIGQELNRDFINRLQLKSESQAVVVDADMQTSTPGIFACGDVAVPAGKYKRITVAVGAAATAVNGIYQHLKNPYWVKERGEL